MERSDGLDAYEERSSEPPLQVLGQPSLDVTNGAVTFNDLKPVTSFPWKPEH